MRMAHWIAVSSLLLAPAAAQDLGARLDELCRPMVEAEVVIGLAVGVIDGDDTVVRGYGGLEAGGDEAPDGNTVYEIGSISKVFTGLLFADAVERGLAAVDDPVQVHLPDGVAMPRTADNEALLWHLSTHVSGMPRMPAGAPDDRNNPFAHLVRDRVYRELGDTMLRHEPGSTSEYSNFAVGLLGQILVEANAATSYDALLRARITGPLGLADTMVALGDDQRARLAPPHNGDGVPDHNWDLAALAGAGGVRSTVNDMLEFARAEMAPDGTPLAAALARSQQRLHQGLGGLPMAYGWFFARDDVTLFHNGQTGGYHAYFAVEPSLRRAVCILSNSARPEIDAVGERILRHLAGIPVAPMQHEKPVAIDRAVLERYVGVYELQPGIEIEVTLRGRGLHAQLTGQEAFRLYGRSDTEFFYRIVQASITFEVNDGATKALVLHQNGRDLHATRR